MPDPWRRAAANLRVDIPRPAAKKGKPAKSWRGLRPGDTLRTKTKQTIGTTVVPNNTLVKVMEVTTVGATLHTDGGVYIKINDPKWAEGYEKVPKRRKGKANVEG